LQASTKSIGAVKDFTLRELTWVEFKRWRIIDRQTTSFAGFGFAATAVYKMGWIAGALSLALLAGAWGAPKVFLAWAP
jgi:hypothetical protein